MYWEFLSPSWYVYHVHLQFPNEANIRKNFTVKKFLHQPVASVKEMNPVVLLRVEALMISCDMRRKQKFLQYLVNVTRRWVTVGWAPESFIWFTLRSHHLLLLRQLLPAFCIFDIYICVCVSEYCPCFYLSGGSSSARRSLQCLATAACFILCIILELPSGGNSSLSHSSAAVMLLWSVALLRVVPQSISPWLNINILSDMRGSG